MRFATRTRLPHLLAAAAISAATTFAFADDKPMGDELKEAGRDVKNAAKDAKDSIVKSAKNDADDRNASNVTVPTLPAGFKVKENDDLEDIRGNLVKLVNQTLTRGDFDDGVAYLSNDDRDRVKGQLGNNFADLDAKVDQFRALFKQKYGEDFKLTREMLDGVTSAQQGEVSDAAVARNSWPVQVMSDTSKTAETPTVNPDPKLENGRDVAVVHLMGIKDKPGLMISMQHELPDSWVVDVPSTVNGQALYKAHVNCVSKLVDKADSWPAAKEDAYRAIASKIIKAYYSDDAAEAPEVR